jgi:hypothetical protein
MHDDDDTTQLPSFFLPSRVFNSFFFPYPVVASSFVRLSSYSVMINEQGAAFSDLGMKMIPRTRSDSFPAFGQGQLVQRVYCQRYMEWALVSTLVCNILDSTCSTPVKQVLDHARRVFILQIMLQTACAKRNAELMLSMGVTRSMRCSSIYQYQQPNLLSRRIAMVSFWKHAILNISGSPYEDEGSYLGHGKGRMLADWTKTSVFLIMVPRVTRSFHIPRPQTSFILLLILLVQ